MILLACIILIIFLPFTYALIEPYLIRKRTIIFKDPDIPDFFVDKKIVFLTDIHHGMYFPRSRLFHVVRRVNIIDPDIILLGGDYVHKHKIFVETCFNELQKLKAKIGIFAVLGNHDHWVDADMIRWYMKKAGITLLENEGEWIKIGNDKIKIGGVKDLWWDDPDVTPIIKDVSEHDFMLLVSHNPDFAEEIQNDKIDLILSGHTHGGQLTFFGLWAPILPSAYGQRYRAGLLKRPHTKVFVSKGLGTISPPFRFFARPEIDVIILKNK